MQRMDKNSKEYQVFKEFFDNLEPDILKMLIIKYNSKLNKSSDEMSDEEQINSLKENPEENN